MVEPRSSLTVAVGGGKGGVGKSLVACNLAVAMARTGFRVVIVDADLGAANQHTLFGISRPGRTIQSLLDWQVESIEEIVIPTSIQRVFLAPGSGAIVGAANIGELQKVKLIRQIHTLDADVVIIDCGAGTGFDVVDLYDAADLRLLVVTPQLTSMQNAYAFVKSAVYRSLRQAALSNDEIELFARATHGSETERISDVLARVVERSPSFARVMERILAVFHASIVGNQLDNAVQRRSLDSLARMITDFLSMQVPVAVTIPRTQRLHESITARRPYLSEHHSGTVTQAFMQLAEQLVTADVAEIRQSRRRVSENPGGLPGPIANHVRAHQRLRCEVPCIVSVDGHVIPGMIVDVSRSGLGVRGPVRGRVGAKVSIEVDGIGEPLVATVARIGEGTLGVHFTSESRSSHLVEALFARTGAGPALATG